MLLSDVCLSDCRVIWPKSRTERPGKTKISTEIANVTRDSDTTFKVKKSITPRGLNARRRARSLGAHGVRRGAGAYCVATHTAC